MGVVKTTVHCWIVVPTIHVHCNSLKPILTEENKWARLEMGLHLIDFIYYSYQDKFKNPRIMKIHQVHQKFKQQVFIIL